MNPIFNFAATAILKEIGKQLSQNIKSPYLDNTGHEVIEAEYKVIK